MIFFNGNREAVIISSPRLWPAGRALKPLHPHPSRSPARLVRERERGVTQTLGRLGSVSARTNNDCVVNWPVWVCYRADLGDTGKHPEPKSIFDFEPGKGAEEDRSRVRDSCH